MAAEATRWRRPTTLFLLFVSLAGLALISLRRFGGTTGSLLEDTYHSVGIFTANGSWAFEPANHVNTFFKVLATATPVFTFIGFVELLTGGVVPVAIRHLALVRLRLGASGYVVCGLNELGLAFAKMVVSRGGLVLVLDDAPAAGLIEPANRSLIPVLPLHVLDRRGTTSVLFKRCDLFSFLPSADQQVDLVSRIDASMTRPSERSFWFLIQERGLAQRLDGYLRFTARNSTLRPRFFDVDALAARQVLARHPLDVLADAAGHTQVHMALAGFGALARAVVKEAARSVVTLPSVNGIRLKVTVIDADASAAVAALEAEDPQIGQLLDLQLVCMNVQPAGLLAEQLPDLPADVTAYFVTFGDPELNFATAVSLRHWLLEPPTHLGEDWRQAHHCVPILIRTRNWEGLGRLIRSNVDWQPRMARAPELPDGIFGFAVTQEIVDPDFIMAAAREAGARLLHQSYVEAGQQTRQRSGGAEARRVAERAWRELATDLRDLNLYGYDHIPMKARAIGHRIVPGTAPAGIPPSVQPMLPLLSQLEHCRYFAERAAGGWRHANTRCDELKLHPDLIDWSQLPKSEQLLDENHVRAMFHALARTGQRMQPSLFIAIIGARDVSEREAAIALRGALDDLVRLNGEAASVILTTLAPGAGMAAAAAAVAMGLPWIAVLPLPFELYREDFSPAERHRLQALIAFAERYVELPLRFGKASELTSGTTENNERRAQQYRLATGFLIERAHALIVVEEPGHEAAAWWRLEPQMPTNLGTHPAFLPRPSARLPAIHAKI